MPHHLEDKTVRNKLVWLFGAGNMGKAYSKALSHMQVPFEVIANSPKNALPLSEEYGVPGHFTGLHDFINTSRPLCSHAIVAVGEELLTEAAIGLLEKGVPNILIEKPGALNLRELERIAQRADETKSRVLIAYNRRYYASTLKARDVLSEDGGALSMHFDFTELADKVARTKIDVHKRNWFFCNSSHVIDLAFSLCGKPESLSSDAVNGLDWHPEGSIFVGHGRTDKGTLFSYHANWQSGGRWSIEICTSRRKLFLSPLEKIRTQEKGGFEILEPPVDYSLDEKFKPGLYRMTETFLENGEKSLLDSVQDHYNLASRYFRMKAPVPSS